MEITGEITSLAYNTKEEFENKFKQELVTDTLRQLISKSMPANGDEQKKLDDPQFREKFNKVLSPMSQEIVNQFQNVSQFDTGNLFASMVNSISNSVSLESGYRLDCLLNDIKLDRVSVESAIDMQNLVASRFEKTGFTSNEIGKRAVEDFKLILSTEDAGDVLDQIKDEVKTAVEETEAKNDLVEGTTKEILDYKKEIAPPEDKYQDPDNPDDTGDDDKTDDTADDDSSTADDTSDTTSDNSDTADNTDSQGDNGNENTGDAGQEEAKTDDKTDNEDQKNTGDAEPPEGNSEDSASTPGTDESDSGETSQDASGDSSSDSGSDEVNSSDDNTDEDSTDVNIQGETDSSSPKDNLDNAIDANSSSTSNAPAAQATPAPISGGIVINITGADLKAAKEACQVLNAENFAGKFIPTHSRTFNSQDLPTVNQMASECVNAIGDVGKELEYKFGALKWAIKEYKDSKEASKESVEALDKKYNALNNISTEALELSEQFKTSMSDLGIGSDSLADSKESTFCVARNIIKLIANTRKVAKIPLPYTSMENVLANAFDIVQMRQTAKNAKTVAPAYADDLFSRENLFYKSIVKFDDPEIKQKAAAVIDLSDMNFQKAISANFITDYKIKAWEMNIGPDAAKNANAVVTDRVTATFENLWGRKLNDDEKRIIEATTNNDDVTEIIPTPYEKFIIKMSRENLLAKGTESAASTGFSKEEKANITFKAKLFTTMIKAAEHFNLIDATDDLEFEKFCDTYNLGGKD